MKFVSGGISPEIGDICLKADGPVDTHPGSGVVTDASA